MHARVAAAPSLRWSLARPSPYLHTPSHPGRLPSLQALPPLPALPRCPPSPPALPPSPQKLEHRCRKDGPVSAFSRLDHTEVPALREHVRDIARRGRVHAA